MNGFMDVLQNVSEWIMKFSVINFLWLCFNLPIIIILINFYSANNLSEVIILFFPLLILIPLLFFPSTSAMFSVVREWIINYDHVFPVVKSYWNYYKQNYIMSMIGGFVFTGLWFIWGAYLYNLKGSNFIILLFLIFVGSGLFVYTIHFFSGIAHYNLHLKGLLRQAFFYTFSSPVLFITTLFSNLVIIMISAFILPVLFFLWTGSLTAFLSFVAYYKYYLKIKDKL